MPPETENILTSESDLDFEDTKDKRLREGSYVCRFAGCRLRFKRQVKLDRHEYKHTGVRKHVCFFEGCNKSYTIITHLKRHVKTAHEGYRPKRNIQCPLDNCKKKFESEFNLERHVKDIHENPKIYPCPNCSSEFQRKIQLKRHLVTHTGEYPYKCDKCKMGFILQRLYNKHSCDPKIYKCQSCGAEFEKWSLLVAHRKTDHLTFYKCDECGKEFKRKEYLNVHLEKHKDIAERQVLECPWEGCDRFYYHARNLKSHIRSKHEGAKYKCSIEGCGKELASKQRLEYHVRLHEIEPGIVRDKSCGKGKAQRSDKGKKKKSYAAVLSGVILNHDAEKAILDGQGMEIDVLAPEVSEETGSDDDVPLSKKIELLAQPK